MVLEMTSTSAATGLTQSKSIISHVLAESRLFIQNSYLSGKESLWDPKTCRMQLFFAHCLIVDVASDEADPEINRAIRHWDGRPESFVRHGWRNLRSVAGIFCPSVEF
jgi:hypothetical protein